MTSPPLPSRPRLRSKRGCYTCRRRRKKCDEHKPRCADCSRHKLQCTWPGDPTPTSPTSDLPAPVDPTALELQDVSWLISSPSWQPPGLNSSTERSLFNHFTINLLPLLVHSEAHPGYTDLNELYMNGLTHPWIMATVLGLSAIHLSQCDNELQTMAYQYYLTAIKAVRGRIESGHVEGTEDWLLSSTIFFYLFEEWSSVTSSNVMQHLEGAAQLFRLRRAKGIRSESAPPELAFYRIAAESFLYHIATLSLFYEDLDSLSAKFSWGDLEYGLNTIPFPDASLSANSPIIGHNPRLYRLVFDITRLSSHMPLEGAHYIEALRYQEELHQWDASRDDRWVGRQSQGFMHTDNLYLFALRIFLHKLLNPQVRSADPQIQELIRGSMSLLQNIDGSIACSINLCWPIFILACAIDLPTDMLLLQEKLVTVWKASLCGQVRRAAIIISRVWKMRSSVQSTDGEAEELNADGLDLLVQRKLIFDGLQVSGGRQS